MNVYQFLSHLRSLDVKLTLDGDQLRCKAPKKVLTPQLQAQIAEYKAEILTFLHQDTSSKIKRIAANTEEIPLSFAQERLWFLNQLEGDSATYNMPAALRLTGELNLAAFHQVLVEIVRRHELLRTSFATVNGTPRQVIHPEATINLEVVDLQHLEDNERELFLEQQIQQSALSPFDLEIAPLIRCHVWQLSHTDYVFCINMHHIVSDGWSIGLFIRELSVLYPAFCAGTPSPLPELEVQYADFALWQRQWLSGAVLEQQLQYWKSQLQDAPELLQLPTDRPRPSIQTHRGATENFSLSIQLTQKLQALSRQTGSTLFMTLLAAFATLMYRYSGQSDILIGSPIANRNRNEIESLIGFFVNTLVLRVHLKDNPSFESLLTQVRETTFKAYQHQDVPFEQVVEALQPQRVISHSPLFQVMFALQNAPMDKLELPSVSLTPLSSETKTAKFDLTVLMDETTQELISSWEYNTELFDRETIEQMAAHFQTLLSAIVEKPQQKVGKLSLFSTAERYHLLQVYNEISKNYWNHKYIHPDSSNNLQIYILDEFGEVVPLGVEGEIYLNTSHLSQSYLHQEGQESVSLIQHPQFGILLKTGEWGRCQRTNSLELLGFVHRLANIKGQRLNLQKIEQALLAVKRVEDCYVMARNQELVAYVVNDGSFSEKSLHNHLKSQLPGYILPCAYVPVSTLPLTVEGQVDEVALASIEVIDLKLVERWEEKMRSYSEIEQVAVVQENQTNSPSRLHLSELLPLNTFTDILPPISSEITSSAEFVHLKTDFEATVPAISDGGLLIIPEETPKTLTEALIQTATLHKEKQIFYFLSNEKEISQTYGSLLKEAQCILNGLQHQGLKVGERIILQIESLRDYFPALWACILGGIQPVTVAVATYKEQNTVVNKLYSAWELLEHPPLLASESLIEPLQNLKELLPFSEVQVLSLEQMKNYPATNQLHPSCPDEVAFLQLTSGSTGIPKCIQETHQGIVTHIHAAQQFNGYDSNNICLNWLPVDHVVPLLTCHFKDTYFGCQQIEVANEVIITNPLKWLDLIEKYRVSHTWSPNFGFKLVSDALKKDPRRTWDLSSIKFWMNAGEQVTPTVVREFLEIVAPFGVSSQMMQPAFGMAEVCTCMTYQNQFDCQKSIHRIKKSSLGSRLVKAEATASDAIEFVDLGVPVPGVQIRITDLENQILPEGMIGRLQIKGKVVTPGYLNNPKVNVETFVGDGWLNTGDLGFILNSRLVLTGREKELIIINGVNYYCHEIEEIVNDIKGVEPTYVGTCSFSNPETGTEGLAIFFTPRYLQTEYDIELIKTIRRKIASQTGITPTYIIPVSHQNFPKTTSGKIQRSRLKQMLELGNFREVIKAIDIHLENANTIPNWFYKKTWHHKQGNSHSFIKKNGVVLVFLDLLGLGELLCQQIESQNRIFIRVKAGNNFAKINANHYVVNPGNKQHYQLLLESLAINGILIEDILHLWSYSEYNSEIYSLEDLESSQQQGVYSLLFLVQALKQIQGTQQPVQLLWIDSHSQFITCTDKIAYEKATVLGLLKTIPQEMLWLSCRHLNLLIAEVEVNSTYVWQELCSPDKELEVAYRNKKRLVSRLESAYMTSESQQEIPLKVGGLYLLTGGLGGIGIEIAKYLLENYQARLLLVGRTSLRDINTEIGDYEDKVARKVRAYQQLQKLSGSVIYKTVDICNLPQLQQVVEEVVSQWGSQLDGVFHLSGVLQEQLLELETPENIAAVLHSKVSGTWVLHQLLKNNADALFIHFSSVNGFFGGNTVAAYAAANSFQSAFCDYQRHNRLHSYCCSWSMWNETGMSLGYQFQEISRAKGYFAILPKEGIYSLLTALSHRLHHVLIGLDSNRPHIRSLIGDCYTLKKLTAYFTTQTPGLSLSKLQEVQLCDRFGVPSQIDFVQLEQMPLTEKGEIDREKLVGIYRDLSDSEQTKPRNEV
ncbi:MAG: SDR family NAD(P)-dependent oxidoreductase, partial [Rhizonema sp. PD38]|nr:SDR family NAD(P)-dependent oxidoreductase [Rhizonema sp. PD38]